MFIFSSGSAEYEISNSLRFDGTNDYLARTFGSPTTQNTFTLSVWVKRSKISATQNLFGVSTNSSIGFNASDNLVVTLAGSATITTSSTYRDVSSHLHIVYRQTTGAAQMYVNGSSVGTSATVSAVFNTAVAHQVGASNTSNYTDGYLSEIIFIDGQSLTPSDFGYADAYGQWRPKKYAGTYGNNGFYLDFKDGSSTTTLGYDAAGSNDWTLTNMVRTGGVDDCWSYDTPTNNFATLNPLAKYTTASGLSSNTTTNGNLDFPYGHALNVTGLFPSTSYAASNTYFEVFADSQAFLSLGTTTSIFLTYGGNTVGLLNNESGFIVQENGVAVSTTAQAGNLEVVGVTVSNTGEIKAYVQNSLRYTSTLLSGNTPINISIGAGTSSSGTVYVNFGQRPVSGSSFDSASGGWFKYTPPSGFKALSSKNLTSDIITVSGTFTGNASTDGPYVWMNGTPTTLAIDNTPVVWGTHADKLANGFKIRTAAAVYNDVASNSWAAGVTASDDPYWGNVVLAMHMDGANNGTTFTDLKGKTVTPNGNVKTVTDTKKYGTASAYFDGTGDYLTLADSADFDLSASDFTIEMWIYNDGSERTVLTKRTTPTDRGFLVTAGKGGTDMLVAQWGQWSSGGVYSSIRGITPGVVGWHHYAYTCSSGTIRCFIDGVLVAAGARALGNSTNLLCIGRDYYSDTLALVGYIDDLRITKGTARYIETFATNNDPYYSSVVLHMPMDGADNGTTFVDLKGKTVTRNGNTVTKTATKKYGTASAYFDGSGDYLTVPSSTDFNFSTGDFTVEFWVYCATNTAGAKRVFERGAFNAAGSIQITIDGSNNYCSVAFDVGGSLLVGTIPTNEWTHVAIVRSSGTLIPYKNGAAGTSQSNSTNFTNTATVYIGASTALDATAYFTGYIDDLRITKGVARYTGAFTPPAAAHPVPNFTPPTAAFSDGPSGSTISSPKDAFRKQRAKGNP